MFVQTHAPECNHNRNRTGIYLAAQESLTVYRPKQANRDSDRGLSRQHQPPPSQQQQNFAAHSAHDQVERFMREKTLLEQLRVRDARRGFVGSRGLENHRLKRMQSCLEGMRLQREPTAASLDSPRLRNSRAAAAPPLSRLVTAAASHSAAEPAAGRQLWRTRRSQLPLTASSLSEPPGQPQQQPQQLHRSFAQPPTVNLGADFQQPAPLPALARGARRQRRGGAEFAPGSKATQQQQQQKLYFSSGGGGGAVAGIGQRLYRMRSGRERLRQLGLRGASNGGDDGASASSSQQPQQQQQQQQQHINDIFRLPDSDAARMDGGAADDNSEAAAAPPPPTAAQLRRRSGRRSQEDGDGAAATMSGTPPPRPTPPLTAGSGRGGASGGCGGSGAGGRRLSSIEMMVQNEDGEAEEVEIDVADTEDDVVAPLAKGTPENSPPEQPALSQAAHSGPDQPPAQL
ncbi:hypothetical protein BOX15_Mlig030416g1 [Macrostomum lignano]|uniref:Uncharacterized protein n=1 Tax=Macrostomum lignano TaxID=282301 RepID=A0A267DYQ1_9PLAT|nr:hypothetical protein BOX15_Mlig030416g1 [Macrostomum lignano]